MFFELGYVLGQGAYKAVAVGAEATNVIVKKSRWPLYRWNRWHFVLVEDGVIVIFPVREGSGTALTVLDGIFWDVIAATKVPPLPFKAKDPTLNQIITACTATIEHEERKVPLDQMKSTPETIWMLGNTFTWSPVELCTRLGVAMDFDGKDVVKLIPPEDAPFMGDRYTEWCATQN